jgi:hypothetical protein
MGLTWWMIGAKGNDCKVNAFREEWAHFSARIRCKRHDYNMICLYCRSHEDKFSTIVVDCFDKTCNHLTSIREWMFQNTGSVAASR